ncbi:glycosyltransferase family 2 protein [Thalassotalea piscium]|uniref:Glycosyltransferase involved in cell wall biosynthesis n=1 Tax=Thalassotalea piscium TaxID=1230533 RepID=A0A7X0TT22_9GAMM|nr:glycosyltransferase family 2 protein [Thalassotalea piscium]MBB6542746.1 glycosyltransferase involved in cell wall biosynthesis [Thalassotalea piscium]
MPKISVILPVYNAEKYIEEAVKSILNQSFHDFEFIIINDGSTDNSLLLLQQLAKEDRRIMLITRENKGLIATLNEAISLAKAEYIARMDADDIALPLRLEKQFNYLTQHPDVAVLGTGYRFMSEAGEVGQKRRTLTSYEDLKASLFFGNPIAHPSVMINYKLLGSKLKYLDEYKTIEDFELWCRIAKEHKIENLKEVLLHYRLLPSSISGQNIEKQILSAAKVLTQQPLLEGKKNTIKLLQTTYCYSINSANYIQLLLACFKLNWINLFNPKINKLNLFKRSLFALLAASKKNLRT